MRRRDSRFGRGDGGTRAARATHPRRGVDPDDLVRLNSLLNADLRFEVDSIELHCGGTASGILVCESSRGFQRTATYPVMFSRRRRKLLHSLSGSLAECAMALGLGAGVYCERALTGAADRCARPGNVSRREWP